MEGQLALNPIDKPYMIRYPKPKVVNIPANRVQDVCDNRHMGVDLDWMNKKFDEGWRIWVDDPNIPDTSCHVDYQYKWTYQS